MVNTSTYESILYSYVPKHGGVGHRPLVVTGIEGNVTPILQVMNLFFTHMYQNIHIGAGASSNYWSGIEVLFGWLCILSRCHPKLFFETFIEIRQAVEPNTISNLGNVVALCF